MNQARSSKNTALPLSKRKDEIIKLRLRSLIGSTPFKKNSKKQESLFVKKKKRIFKKKDRIRSFMGSKCLFETRCWFQTPFFYGSSTQNDKSTFQIKMKKKKFSYIVRDKIVLFTLVFRFFFLPPLISSNLHILCLGTLQKWYPLRGLVCLSVKTIC